jgi:trimeric autotransporter adhesin
MRTAYWAINQEKKETYMSKNLTRKGLALGAVVALGTSLFAGAPAFAAPTITVAPTSGTGYTVLASDTFGVKVFSNTEYTFTTSSDLHWKVTKPSATASVAFSGSGTYTSLAASTSTVEFLDAGTAATGAGANTLVLDPTISSSAADQVYVIQAYIESGDAAGLTAGDLASAAVTVKFAKGANLTSVVTVDPVSVGLPVTGTVKYSDAGFNYSQSTLANTKVLVSANGGSFSAAQSVTLNTDEDGFEYSTSVQAVAANDIIGVKSEVIGYDSDSVKTNSVTVYSSGSAASTALAAKNTTAVGENIVLTAGSDLSGDYSIRTGTKSFSYRVDFYKEAGKVNLVAAGQPVRITIDELNTTITTNDVIRVNGKKLTGGAGDQADAVLNTVTDATGGITVAVESDLGLVGDQITITVRALTASGNIESINDFIWADAALTTFTASEAQLGGDGTTHAPDRVTAVIGSSVTVKYAIRDQFGKLWTKTGTNYRASVVASGGTLVQSTTTAFSGGLATLTFTDNSTSANPSTVLTADLQEQTSPTGAFSASSSGTSGADVVTNMNIVSAAQAAATLNMNAAVNTGSTATYSSTAGVLGADLIVQADKSLKAIDLRSNANGSAIGNNTANAAKISGTVLNSNGSPAAGVSVVVASAGRWFSTTAGGSAYVSADSITVNTNVNGTYNVWALSQRGGAAAITITSGSVSKTQNVKWAAAAATSGTTIVITAPSNSLPGRTVDVVALLTDKNGAAVQTTTNGVERLSVAVTGPGSNTAIPATTDSDGKLSFKLIFGANDLGTASVKVTYDADGDATVYAPVVVTKVIEVSSTLPSSVVANVAGSTKRFFVSVDGNSSARNVVVKVAGKTFKTLKGSTAKKSYAVAAPKGTHKVTVFVGGKLIATKTISVK